jgi:hypothetical protein
MPTQGSFRSNEPSHVQHSYLDTSDDVVVHTLSDLHKLTFFDDAPVPQFDLGCGGRPITGTT